MEAAFFMFIILFIFFLFTMAISAVDNPGQTKRISCKIHKWESVKTATGGYLMCSTCRLIPHLEARNEQEV